MLNTADAFYNLSEIHARAQNLKTEKKNKLIKNTLKQFISINLQFHNGKIIQNENFKTKIMKSVKFEKYTMFP